MTNGEYVIDGVSLTNLGANNYKANGAGGIYGGSTMEATCAGDASSAQSHATSYNTNNGNFN